MGFAEIVAIVGPIVVALIGLWRVSLERKGKNEVVAVLDTVIDGIEIATDSVTKRVIKGIAETRKTDTKLDAILDAKGVRKSAWKTGIKG